MGDRIVTVVAGERTGGRVLARVSPVHTHECKYWRLRQGKCRCGALDLWKKFVAEHGENPWDAVRVADETGSM